MADSGAVKAPMYVGGGGVKKVGPGAPKKFGGAGPRPLGGGPGVKKVGGPGPAQGGAPGPSSGSSSMQNLGTSPKIGTTPTSPSSSAGKTPPAVPPRPYGGGGGGGVKKVGFRPNEAGGATGNANPSSRPRGVPEPPTYADQGSTVPVVVVDSSATDSTELTSTNATGTSNTSPSTPHSQQTSAHSSTSDSSFTSSTTDPGTNTSSIGQPISISSSAPVPIGGANSTDTGSTPMSSSPSSNPSRADMYLQAGARATMSFDPSLVRKGSLISGGSSSGGLGGGPGGSGGGGGANSGNGGMEMEAPTPANASKRIESVLEAGGDFDKVEVPIKSKRDNAAYEILTTEQSYCRSLTVLNHLYRLPLLEACRRNQLPGITEDLVTNIFSRYFEDIIRVNFALLHGLVVRLSEWTDQQLLGDELLRLLPFLKMYTLYTGNYERSMAALAELEAHAAKETSPTATFMNDIHSNPFRTVDLRSYLIMPIQRIPRYRLLLEELIKNTTEDHPDYAALQQALNSIKTVATQIDAAIHEQKNRVKLLEIQDSFFGEKVQIIEAGRTFIKEGELEKVCRKDVQKRTVWLFNDLFLYAKQLPSSSRYSKHRAFPLQSIRIKDMQDDGKLYRNAIQVASERKSFVLLAPTPEDKAQWMTEFTKAISDQANTITAKSTGQQTAIAPVWVPDSEALRCMICGDKFTLMQRRHHCRQCGNVVCAKCSAKKKDLPGQGKKRVCDSCYKKPYPDASQSNSSPNATPNMDHSPGTSHLNVQNPPPSLDSSASSVGSSAAPSPSPTVQPIAITNHHLSAQNSTPDLANSPSSTQATPPSTHQGTPGSARGGEMFRAAYDYEPPVEVPKKKLGFKAGDVLEITSKNDPGWWYAILGESKGWVPASFLEPI